MPFAWPKTVLHLLVALLALGAGTASAQMEAMGQIKSFRVPEFDEKGVLKSEIFGDVAQPVGDDRIRIEGLKIVVYRANKEVEATLTSDRCTVDRRDRSAFSNAEVKIVRGNVVITGKGFRWTSGSQRIEILNKFHMVMTGTVKVWPLVKEKQ